MAAGGTHPCAVARSRKNRSTDSGEDTSVAPLGSTVNPSTCPHAVLAAKSPEKLRQRNEGCHGWLADAASGRIAPAWGVWLPEAPPGPSTPAPAVALVAPSAWKPNARGADPRPAAKSGSRTLLRGRRTAQPPCPVDCAAVGGLLAVPRPSSCVACSACSSHTGKPNTVLV